MKRTNKRYILFSFITFFVFLVLMEGGLRTYFWIRSKIDAPERNFQEYLGWETGGNVSSERVVKGYGTVKYSTGQYGFRRFGDPETDRTKILVIGDSFTAGHTVSDGETYYDYLEKHDDNIEVFVYGGGGYGTLQEFMILDRYVDEIRPDVVLWQWCSNDLINNSHELESASFGNNNQMTRPYYKNGRIEWLFPRQYGGSVDKLIQSSYLLRLLNIRWNILAAEKKESIEWRLTPDHALLRESTQMTVDILKLAQERLGGIPVFAFSVDAAPWVGPIFQDICDQLSIDFIPGIPEAVAEAKKSGVVVDGLPYDGHWNGAGHAIAGEIILRYLRDNGELRKRKRNTPKTDGKSSALLDRYAPPSFDAIPVEKLSLAALTSRNSDGFGELEGPYPKWNMPAKVRWMVSPEATIKLVNNGEKGKEFRLNIRILSKSVPQSFTVLLNEVAILEEKIQATNQWYALTARNITFCEGKNVLRFRANQFKRYPDSPRDLYVLFDALAFQLVELDR
jgi:hypothetical protein